MSIVIKEGKDGSTTIKVGNKVVHKIKAKPKKKKTATTTTDAKKTAVKKTAGKPKKTTTATTKKTLDPANEKRVLAYLEKILK